MEIKAKLAALLRRWAYALHPETSATLPPGYDLKQVVSQYRYTLKDGKMPEAAVVDSFRDAITDDIIKYVKDAQGQTVTRTTWVSCLKPGDGAVVNYLKKGTQVFCRGNLTAKPYTGKNGLEAGLNCTVTELELLGSRQDTQQNQQTQPGAATPPQSYPTPAETYPGGYSGSFPTQNEDRPF